MGADRRAVALVDGEHYPPVVRDALSSLRADGWEVAAALLVGGGEKLRRAPVADDYAVPALAVAGAAPWDDAAALATAHGASAVWDLTDEPVTSQRLRLRVAASALAAGVAYRGAGIALDPPRLAPYGGASIAVVGTGKRVGKTAVAGALARRARARLAPAEVVVVAMGRGGPAAPEEIDPATTPLGVASLLARSRGGAHAASDHLEDALLAGVRTVGCRRCGGGPAGEVAWSNVVEGAALAAARAPALTLFEGSGAALPPIVCRRTLLVASAATEPEEIAGYLGPLRPLLADAALVTGAEVDPAGAERVLAALRSVRPELPALPCALEPEPASPVAGRRVAVFTTAPATAHARIARLLAGRHGAEVVLVSGALADRARLRADIEAAATAEVLVTELKAAAIDVVAEAADASGRELVFLANAPRALDGGDAVDVLLDGLVDGATAPGAGQA